MRCYLTVLLGLQYSHYVEQQQVIITLLDKDVFYQLVQS